MKPVNAKIPAKGGWNRSNGCLAETVSFWHAQKNSSAIRHQSQSVGDRRQMNVKLLAIRRRIVGIRDGSRGQVAT